VGKKVKVVFDTNVWISIFMQRRVRNEFLRVKQNLTVYISEDIGLEVSKVLQYPKVSAIIKKTGTNEKELLRTLKDNSTSVETKVKLHVVNEDAQDNKILECALAAGADVIVTGDKHLLNLGRFKKTKILTPRQFFDSIT
jgi:uncharacterized protein